MKGELTPSSPQYKWIADAAAYIADARPGSCTGAVREAALKCTFDLLGATLAGIDDTGPVALRRAAPCVFGTGDIAIWFTGTTGSVIGAAWCNSSAAAALDLDDGNRFARGHPGAAVIPTAFAVGQATGASLDEILTAIVVGYEVGVEVGAARTQYGSSGTWTAYGVVATAAVLRRTPRHIIEHALAIAGESAPNQAFAGGPAPRIPAPEGAAVKEGIPWSVVTGLAALYMADAGHTGPRNILDSARHYRFADDLSFGSAQHICQSYFKPYACCRHVHAPIAALLQLIEEHGIDVHSIEQIQVDTHSAALRISNRPDPQNLIDVQYSIPYCLAQVALHGAKTLLPVTTEALTLPGVGELARKVSLALDADLDAAYPEEILARVAVVVAGRRFVSQLTPPPGEPLMPWKDLEEKFVIASRFVTTQAQRDRVLEAMNLARRGEIQTLQHCLAALSTQ